MKHLRHYPFALAWWIETRNSLSRARRLHSLVAIGILAFAAVVFTFGRGHFAGADRLQWIGEYEGWIAVLAATHAAFLIVHRRRLSALELKQSWLAATQFGAATLNLAVFLRTIRSLVSQILLAIVVVLMLVAAESTTLQSGERLLLLLSGGALVGGTCGWLLGRPRALPSRVSMRFTHAPVRTRSSAIRGSVIGLSHWPISQVLFWSSPKALRWPFVLAAMSVPLGASGGLGIMIVGSWALGLYMISILLATMRSAREAGRWLFPTPIRFASFGAALIGRAFTHQLIATAVLTVIVASSSDRSAAHATTARVFLVWFISATTASVIAVAEGFRMRGSRIPVAIALAFLLLTASYAPLFLGPIALSWMAFYCWRGARRV